MLRITVLLLHLNSVLVLGDFQLTILHTNDVHARIEQFNENIGYCSKSNEQKCFGGVARRYTVINDIRRKEKNVLLLDAGDQYTGTLWFNNYKGVEAVKFMNYTRYDAMAIGNHEFDNGPTGLLHFIENANFTVLAANMDASRESLWPKSLKFNTKSVVLERNGKKIGIIGYITPETSWLSNSGRNIKFLNVVESVRQEAKRLEDKGISIIIALGHAGIETDIKVAKEVEEVDIVVGGHTNTFLYNGPPPSIEKPYGPYPLHFQRPDGSNVLVVQDYKYGKYIGYLNVTFKDKGKLKSWNGNPLLLNSSYDEDPHVLDMVKKMKVPFNDKSQLEVGRSLVHLLAGRENCYDQECNLGNLLTDAIVKMNNRNPDDDRWATVALCIYNQGGIRASIEKNKTEPITYGDLNRILPFGNTADIMEIDGKTLKIAFERSVSSLPILAGRFLQVSGFQVKYDLRKPVGNRLVYLKAICSSCLVPHYKRVDDKKTYKVFVPTFIGNGGDGYHMFANLTRHTGDSVISIFENYLRKESPVYATVEGRIQFADEKDDCKNGSNKLVMNVKLMHLIWVIYLLRKML